MRWKVAVATWKIPQLLDLLVCGCQGNFPIFRISEVPITTYHNNCLGRQLWEQFSELPNHRIKILTYRWASELSMTRSKVGDPEKPLNNSLLMNISITKKGVPWRSRFVRYNPLIIWDRYVHYSSEHMTHESSWMNESETYRKITR